MPEIGVMSGQGKPFATMKKGLREHAAEWVLRSSRIVLSQTWKQSRIG